MESALQDFYRNKKILLTGATGFLGRVFLEKLLRSTEVVCVYVLIRPKRMQTIDQRLKEIYENVLYEKLLKVKPHATKRIIPICGDCSQPKLAISEADRQILLENVDVIVHAAATVRFNEPLYSALCVNVRATKELIELARHSSKMQSFVYVSSAYANCTVQHIEEKFYVHETSNSAENVLKLADTVAPDILNAYATVLCNKFPNTYTYTKALAEELVMRASKELPICVLRLGIIVSTYDEPVQGWVHNFIGPFKIVYAMLQGMLHVNCIRKTLIANIVPVDFCTNAILACGWHTAEHNHKIQPAIYNFVAHESNAVSWHDFKVAMDDCNKETPLTTAIWYPFLIQLESTLLCRLLRIWYHTTPACVYDFVLLLMGRKRRMVSMYRKMDNELELLDYFVKNKWTYTMRHTETLWKSLGVTDQRLFNFDMKCIEWPRYLKNIMYGVRCHLAKETPESIPKAQWRMKMLLLLHHAVQLLLYGGMIAIMLIFVLDVI